MGSSPFTRITRAPTAPQRQGQADLAQLVEHLICNQRVGRSNRLVGMQCGSSSVVEHHLAMVGVASSNLVFRFHYRAGVAELADAQDLKSCGE